MASRSLVLVGAPDSGKTNYLARLWAAVKEGEGLVRANELPQDISYVDHALEYLLRGQFALRTEVGDERDNRSFSVLVERKRSCETVELVVPDVSGELWREAVESYELPSDWMRKLEQSVGALLFVRIQSDQIVTPLDWVTSRELLNSDVHKDERKAIPTAVQLCELIRFLEVALGRSHTGKRSRVAVLITAWDRLHSDEAKAGPKAFLEKEFPLFAGRIANSRHLETNVFGVSIVGGDFDADPDFKQEFLREGCLADRGYVVMEHDGKIGKSNDTTTPVDWVLSSEAGNDTSYCTKASSWIQAGTPTPFFQRSARGS